MTVQDKAEAAVDETLETFDDLAGDRDLIVENATELAMERLEDDEWTGDEDQWHEIEGLVGRVYDRKMGE